MDWRLNGSRPGSNPAAATSLRNFGNSVYPALPVYFRGDTKSLRSLLSGVYVRGSKISHHSALECVTVVRLCSVKCCPALNMEEDIIDLFRGACTVKGNVPVAGHVKRVDHGDAFDA